MWHHYNVVVGWPNRYQYNILRLLGVTESSNFLPPEGATDISSKFEDDGVADFPAVYFFHICNEIQQAVATPYI